MGQTQHHENRNGGSFSGYFLSPSRGTSSVSKAASLAQFLPYAAGVFSLAFLASCITASIMTPVQNSDATAGLNLDTNAVSYYVNIASNNGSGGTISKDIQATYAGTLGVITDTLKIKSNTPNGYYVYVSVANGYNQNLTNTSDSSYYLSPIDTSTYSVSNPGTLSTENTWGVAVGNTYNANYDVASNYTDATVSQSTKFGPVPAYGSEELLITRTGSTVVSGAESDTSLATEDTIPVFYGYHVNSALLSGTYANTVLYTAYAEAATSPTASASGDVADYTDGTTRISFTTSLYTDRTITADQVSVTIGNKACTDIVVSKVDAGNNDSVMITCTAPAQPGPGDYTATITIADYGHVSTATVAYGYTGDEPRLLVAVTKNGTTVNYAINTMQDFADPAGDGSVSSSDICAAWDGDLSEDYYDYTNKKPKAFTTGDGPIYKYGSNLDVTEDTIVADPATNWSSVTSVASVTSGSAVSNINTHVPEVTLTDERDGNEYRIRKLADGNCWMTENLRLVFDRDSVNSVGVVNSNGQIVAQNPVVTINEDNSNVGANAVGGSSASNFDADTFASELAYTEVAGTLGIDRTIWGRETGTKHSTSKTTVTNNEANSAISMEYSRSYYNSNAYNKNNKTNFLNDDDEQTVGTYYNWKTATAGTGSTANSSTTDSICPKGWQLPVNTENSGKSWIDLIFNTYGGGNGYDASTNPDGITQGSASSKTVNSAHIYAMSQTMRRAPLSLPFSGNYRYYSGVVNNVGGEGIFWSSTSYSTRYAYFLYFHTYYLSPQYNLNKGAGFPVRCVAQ